MVIIYQDRRWNIAEGPEKESIFRQVGTCFIGAEKTPEHGDFVFMDCSNLGWSKDLDGRGLGVVCSPWGSYAVIYDPSRKGVNEAVKIYEASLQITEDWDVLKATIKNL